MKKRVLKLTGTIAGFCSTENGKTYKKGETKLKQFGNGEEKLAEMIYYTQVNTWKDDTKSFEKVNYSWTVPFPVKKISEILEKKSVNLANGGILVELTIEETVTYNKETKEEKTYETVKNIVLYNKETRKFDTSLFFEEKVKEEDPFAEKTKNVTDDDLPF